MIDAEQGIYEIPEFELSVVSIIGYPVLSEQRIDIDFRKHNCNEG